MSVCAPLRSTLLALSCAGASVAMHAAAQELPKQISIVVGFPAGGGTDIFARLFARQIAASTGASVIVDNRPGASSTLGTHAVVRAAPNGQTLLFTSASLALSKALYRKLPFEPERDLAPLALTARIPFVLVAHPALPVRSVKELIALAKRRPGAIDYGSSGTGSAPYFAMEMLKASAGVDVNHVPYKGAGPNTTGQMSGEVQLSMLIPPVSQPHIQSGRMRALAVTTLKRSSAYPDLPTIAESGVPGFDVPQWHAFFAPAGTPAGLLAKLNAEIVKALNAAEVRHRLAVEGADAASGAPAELAAQLAADIKLYSGLAERLELKLD